MTFVAVCLYVLCLSSKHVGLYLRLHSTVTCGLGCVKAKLCADGRVSKLVVCIHVMGLFVLPGRWIARRPRALNPPAADTSLEVSKARKERMYAEGF